MLDSEGKPIRALAEVIWEEDETEEKIIFTKAYIFLPLTIIFTIALMKFKNTPVYNEIRCMHATTMYRIYNGTINFTNPKVYPEIDDDLIVASENISRNITENFTKRVDPICYECNTLKTNISDIIEIAKRGEKREIIQLQNVFVDRYGSIISNNTVFKQDKNIIFNNNITYNYNEYDSLIAITNGKAVNEYDFWLFNVLPLISLIPKKLIKKSMILISDASNYMIDAIDFLNISTAKIVSLDYDELFFAHNVYTFSNVPHERIDPNTLLTFRARVAKVLRLDKHHPTRYIFYMRWKNDEIIRNAYETMAMIRARLGLWNWETFDSSPRFADNAKRFNKVYALVIPTGRGLASTMWMQRGTVVLELLHSRGNPSYDYAYYSSILGHRHIIYANIEKVWKEPHYGLLNWEAFPEISDLVF